MEANATCRELIGNCARAGRYDRSVKVIFAVIFALQTALCCELVVPDVEGAARRAEIIFRGTITEIRESDIVFRVDRVWKGRVGTVFVMPKIAWRDTPCLPGFYQAHVSVGAELLVYARKLPWLNVTGYIPEAGSRTALTRD